MPGPMPSPQGAPPQGAPPGAGGPPSGAPPQGPPGGAPPGGAPQGQGGGGIGTLLTQVDKAIDQINMVVSQSKAASPMEKQLMSQIDQLYGKFMSSVGAGGEQGDDDSDGDAQGQTVPQQAAGNKGAIPSPV